jgi:hypothetical protein
MDQENKCLLEEGANPPLRETSHQQKYKNNIKQHIFFFFWGPGGRKRRSLHSQKNHKQ